MNCIQWARPVILALALAPLGAMAQEAEVDAIVDHFLGQLAKTQRFTRLRTLSAEGAKIGSIYGVVSPEVTCLADLRKEAALGVPIQVQYLDDMPSAAFRGGTVSNWTSVNIRKVLGANAEADIGAKLPDRRAELKAALDFLKASQAQIIFGVLERPSLPLRQAGRSYLKDQGLERASDAGTEVTGILVPHAQLLLQKFEFNRESLKSGEAGVGVNLLELIGLKIGAKAKQVDALDFKLPTNAVFAFRAEPLLFAQDCAQPK